VSARPRYAALRFIAGAVIAVLFAATLVSYVVQISQKGHPSPITDPIDLVAFYCGGRVLAERRDPYTIEPLRTCERAALRESGIAIVPNLVVPAPLPPYALALFSAASLVSFRAASTVFFCASLFAIGLAIALTIRLARGPPLVIAGAYVTALVFGSLLIGQIVPLVLAALCASALALRAGRIWLSVACASLAMLEPHVGVAALAGIFVTERRARLPVCASAVALAALSLAAGGFDRNLEYALAVLPAHARSEVSNFYAQYSLTALLYACGAPAQAALRWGECSYVAAVLCGVAVARKLARTYGDAAFAVLAPVAFALIGGAFIHIQQMALALPLGFLFVRYHREKTLAFVAIALLAVPWESLYEIFFYTHVVASGNPAAALARVWNPAWLADRVWQVWIELIHTRDGRTPFQLLLFKLPTWLGLAALALVALQRSPPAALRSTMRR